MERTEQLSKRFREVLLDGTWIANTNYKDQLDKLDLEIAQKEVATLNSISALAQHIHYYIAGIKNVFLNGKLEISDKFSFDFPLFASQIEWEVFLHKFWDDTHKLADLIGKMPEEQLDDDFVDPKYGTYFRNIDGMIEHCYYHLGQIVLLKKMIVKN